MAEAPALKLAGPDQSPLWHSGTPAQQAACTRSGIGAQQDEEVGIAKAPMVEAVGGARAIQAGGRAMQAGLHRSEQRDSATHIQAPDVLHLVEDALVSSTRQYGCNEGGQRDHALVSLRQPQLRSASPSSHPPQ